MKNIKKTLISLTIILSFLFANIVPIQVYAQDTQYGKGYIKDTVDQKDNKFEDLILGSYQASDVVFEELDLRDQFMPDIYESQGTTNSCVAYATTRAIEYQVNKVFYKKYNTNSFKFDNTLSKKFLYYNSRYFTYMDDELVDGGSSYRYAFRSLMMTGISIQGLHNDTLSVFTKPSFDAVINANQYKINAYYTVETLQGVVNSLKLGLPVLIGTDIDAFSDARANGFSAKSETWNSTTTVRANHAMTIVALKNINEKWYFVIANSWGKEWGDGGYAYVDAQKMWDYNLEVAHVVILDTFSEDLDIENINYLKTGEIPKNTVIIGKYVFDLDYANDIKNIKEIQEKIVLSNNNVYIKTASGEIINNTTEKPSTVAQIITSIGNKLIYKDKNGIIINLTLK